MYGGTQRDRFAHALYYTEKIQMTVFCAQEFVISGIYLWKTIQLLNCISAAKAGTRRIMWELLAINTIIIMMDTALLALEYSGLLAMERAFKSVIYSYKLKLEFAVLNRLVNLVQSNRRNLSNALTDVELYVTNHTLHTDARSPTVSMPPVRQQDLRFPDWIAKSEGPFHVERTSKVELTKSNSLFITVPEDVAQDVEKVLP